MHGYTGDAEERNAIASKLNFYRCRCHSLFHVIQWHINVMSFLVFGIKESDFMYNVCKGLLSVHDTPS